jgi:hypothetical protein
MELLQSPEAQERLRLEEEERQRLIEDESVNNVEMSDIDLNY